MEALWDGPRNIQISYPWTFFLVLVKNVVYIPTGLTTLQEPKAYHCRNLCKSYDILQKVGRVFSYQFDIVQATCNTHNEIH